MALRWSSAVPGGSEADGGSGAKGVCLGAPDLDSVSLWDPLEVAMQQCNELVACRKPKKATNIAVCLAAKRKRLRRRDMRWGQREVPVMMQCTTAWLLQSSRIRSVDQHSPHMYAASTIGYNSFHWMLCESCAGVHLPLNQWPWQYAP